MFEFNINDHKYKNIHMIGIGGISMSGIAILLKNNGYNVTGSDLSVSETSRHLDKNGIDYVIGQKKENIKNPDLVIYTDAISDNNEELIAARSLGVPVVTRGVFLGGLMKNYKNSIAVSGSHGKSTTTSMISKILMNSTKNPTILLGGDLDEIEGNVHVGNEEILVTEACEYKGNIRYYYPSIGIILNIDEDHLDYYKDLNDIIETFKSYLKNQDENSKTILNLNEENNKLVIDSVQGELITYGQENPDADYNATNITFDEDGKPRFDLIMKDGSTVHFELSILGRHNINNACAAIISTLESGVDIETIKNSIQSYKGLERRMQLLGNIDGCKIILDYGHHPSEIQVNLSALAEHTKGRLICVWQPHTYTRTKRLFNEFVNCFDDADEVIITDIFAAREPFDPSISSKDIVDALVKKGKSAKYLPTFDQVEEYVLSDIKENDQVIVTGSGDSDHLAKMIAGISE